MPSSCRRVVVIKAATGRAWPMKSHDLARNGLEITGDVLFVRGSTDPGELYRVFPGRTVWVYERDLQRSREWLYPVPNNISLSNKAISQKEYPSSWCRGWPDQHIP